MAEKTRVTRKKTKTPPAPEKRVVISSGQPYNRTTQPHQPTGQRNVTIQHKVIRAIQYDFYFPIAIWHHPAVATFKINIGSIAGGATVFKGATGVWTEEKEEAQGVPVEEDVYIWRIVVPGDADTAAAYRNGIHSYVATMMARLSECDLSRQGEFMFTETLLVNDRTLLTIVP